MIKFTVPENPIGYLRMTQGQVKLMRIPPYKLRPDGFKVQQKIRRYLEYKSLVFMMSIGKGIDRRPKEKVRLITRIYFSSNKHPDAENVHKGISDAIFENDKMVSGSFDFFYDSRNPRVEIEIIDPKEGEL